jgi:hypothetical protein
LFHGVQGYPTLKAIKNGKSYSYDDNRELSSLKKFVAGGYSRVTPVDVPTGSLPIQFIHVIYAEINKMVSSSWSNLPYAFVTIMVCPKHVCIESRRERVSLLACLLQKRSLFLEEAVSLEQTLKLSCFCVTLLGRPELPNQAMSIWRRSGEGS